MIVLGSSFVSCVRGIGHLHACLYLRTCSIQHPQISNEKLLLAPACCCCCCCCAPPACSYRRSLCLAARQPLLSVLESRKQQPAYGTTSLYDGSEHWRYPLWNTVIFTTIAEGVQFSHPRGRPVVYLQVVYNDSGCEK
jgi:hypothetical protein